MTGTAIAIIPARGGSKRVPRKNVREMFGRPLIVYTIEAALQSGVFARVLVSTDNDEIAAVAQAHGAEVPFLRPSHLADDMTPVSAATVDMLRRIDLGNKSCSLVCQLMANCPLRDAADVVNSQRQFVETGAPSQISVVRYGWQNPWWAMRRDANHVLAPLFPEAQSARSQDLPAVFCPTGAVWWARADVLRSENTFHVVARTGWEIDWRKGLDIDTEEDWAMAELLIRMSQSNTG